MPLVWEAPNPQATLAAYAALYLQEEVQAEALVRQIGDFSRFLEVISFSQGILGDLLLGFRLPVFQRRAQRQLVQHQKFFFFDAGVFRSPRPRGPLDAPEEIQGLALESLVAQHLLALCQLRANGIQLSFWRTRAGLEVDFVLYGPNLFQAIEVKRAAKVTSADLKGLKAFQADYPEAQCLLLSFCPEPLLIDGIRCEPLEGWLRELRPSLRVSEPPPCDAQHAPRELPARQRARCIGSPPPAGRPPLPPRAPGRRFPGCCPPA